MHILDSVPPYVNRCIDLQSLSQIQVHFQNDKENPTQHTDDIWLINILEMHKYIHQQSQKKIRLKTIFCM